MTGRAEGEDVAPNFVVGQLVGLKADPSRQGPVIEILPPVAGVPRYRVFHSPTDQSVYDEVQLLTINLRPGGGLGEALAAGRWLSPEIFRSRLTASRLKHPELDTLYALRAARIKFIPFQMKPLLRFLRADRPRLLIADEVGVGKTIEAGLILKELQSRQRVDNVLIVCPKALVPKWQAEMRRFDEDFHRLTPESLRYCLDETYKDGGVWPARYARSIVHLELLRIGGYLDGTDGRHPHPGLRALDPAPSFDLVIVDEAHHVRNPGTNSFEVAQTLCEMAEAAVFLSATPVHLGSSNLFALLNLLRPDLFPDEDVFEDVIEPNRYLTAAMRHVRTRAPRESWQRDAWAELRKARGTAWGTRVLASDPRFQQWYEALGQREMTDDAERIRCLRDLEELHSLAHIMNRTRRRDIEWRTVRDPHTVTVPFTPEQEVFYGALIAFRRELLALDHDPRVVRLITDTLERQAASCLPALVPMLDRFLRTGAFRTREVSDDLEAEEETAELAIPNYLIVRAQELRTLAAALPPGDPKLTHLITIVEDSLWAKGPGKVLVFSFFLHTLAYLRDQLQAAGYRVELITGQVADEEREHLRGRFRLPRQHPDAVDVLLSSEVGCEGLDYEFCDRMVNYDIPWNPMRIEQRIGRIDRFGQTAEKVLIFNFITPGTVEERIFFRCFERLGIFRETVGDLEEVLGEIVGELNEAAMDPTLTLEQAETRAQQAADNALLLLEEQARLERESSGLLGLDEGFMDDIESAQQRGKFVSPDDLRLMIDHFLAQPRLDGRISPDGELPSVYRLRLRKEARAELHTEMRAARRHDRQSTELLRWLAGGEPYLLVTFDQGAALEHREIAFITPVHPLAKMAVEYWQGMEEPLVSSPVVSDGSLPAGRYLFGCELWRSVAANPEVRMVCLAYDLCRNALDEAVSDALLHLLHGASAAPSDTSPGEDLDAALVQLDEAFHARRVGELRELRERNGALVSRRVASLEAYYKSRLARVREALDSATDERIIRMRRAERSRIEGDYARKRREIEGRREADIIADRIAIGLLEVCGAE